jgi:hypothetical protein
MSGGASPYRDALRAERCWDARTQALYEAHGEPLDDCMLQNREELIALCDLIAAWRVRSFLEIGVWTGRLVSTLHRIFAFDKVAACDHGYAETLGLTISLPPDAHWLRADSDSPAHLDWRQALGHFDLVFIDADHRYHAVKRDFALNKALPHRFLAFHDIAGKNRHTVGVKRFWDELDEGYKLELLYPHPEVGSPTPTMGIGVWSRTPFPAIP